MKSKGLLRKMKTSLEEGVAHYILDLDSPIAMNDFIGSRIQLDFTGELNCISCGNKISKTFGEGLCYPDFKNGPLASECILRPELCEAHEGRGRDVQWEEEHHNKPHLVYLSLTGGRKVGVTRLNQVPHRWIDQGARKAILLAETPYRRLAGEIEVEMKEYISDRTNWRRMLKNDMDEIDLLEEKEELLDRFPYAYQDYISDDDDVVAIDYPVLTYPEKIKSLNFDKVPSISGQLKGIVGQYLLLDEDRVINLRRHSGYNIEIELT